MDVLLSHAPRRQAGFAALIKTNPPHRSSACFHIRGVNTKCLGVAAGLLLGCEAQPHSGGLCNIACGEGRGGGLRWSDRLMWPLLSGLSAQLKEDMCC